jgi:hypothetical protein
VPDDLTPAEASLYHQAMQAEYAIFGYKPSPTQLAFHQSQVANRLLTTGGQQGKTTAGVTEVSWLFMGCHPWKENHNRPISILVLSLTRQNASQVVQRKMFETSQLPGELGGRPFIPESEMEPGEHTPLRVGFPTYYRVKHRNGNIIEFAWSDDPKSWLKVQGSQRDLIYLDEARCTRELFIELQKRLAKPRSEAKRGIGPKWLGSFVWGATATEDSEPFEDFRERCESKDAFPDHEIFLIKPGETGAIDAAVTAEFSDILSEDERKVHITGEESAGAVQRVYPEFSEDRHLLKTDYEPRPCDNLWLCYDPGWDHPTGMFIGCLRPGKPFQKLVVHCWKHAGKSTDYDVACLKHYLRGRALAGVIYDYNAGEQKKNSVSVIQSIRDAFQKEEIRVLGGWYKSKKSNTKGIPLVKAHLDPDHYNKSKEPLLMLNPTPESGGRLMAIEFRKYKGRPATKFSGPNGVIKLNDDLMDPLKYWCAEMVANQWQQTFACGSTDLSIVPLSERPQSVNEGPKSFASKHDELMERAKITRGIKRHQWMVRYQ